MDYVKWLFSCLSKWAECGAKVGLYNIHNIHTYIHTYIHTNAHLWGPCMYACILGTPISPPRRKIRICAFQSTPRERLSGHMTSLKISILPCGDKYPLYLCGHFQISVLTSTLCGPIYIFILKDETDQQGLGLSSTLTDRIFWATIFQTCWRLHWCTVGDNHTVSANCLWKSTPFRIRLVSRCKESKNWEIQDLLVTS